MDSISLIDASRAWIYNKNRKKDNKWKPRKIVAIVRVYPRFILIPPRVSDKFVDFFFSELLLYKPFHDIQADIGDDNITIISNWESLDYVPWHVERRVDVQSSDGKSESASENNVMGPPNIIEEDGKSSHGCIMVN